MRTLYNVTVAYCVLIMGMWLASLIYGCHHSTAVEQPIHDTIVDTIKVVKPIVRDSVVTRYKVVNVERVKYVDSVTTISEVVFDTVMVRLPIESKHYEGENYEAWVSGYESSLDSINIYNRTILQKPKRWSIGVQGGVGITPKGIQPYLGLGVSYRFVGF